MRYRHNPRDAVPDWASDVVQLWALCRSEFGLAHLPDPGGMNRQSAWLMDAFSVCTAAEIELRKEERPDADRR